MAKFIVWMAPLPMFVGRPLLVTVQGTRFSAGLHIGMNSGDIDGFLLS
jgi:hypothetical protein